MLIVEKQIKLQSKGLTQKNYYTILATLLIILGLVGYGFTLNNFFVADDYFLLRTAHAGWFPFSRGDFPFYRPLTLLTWFAQSQIFGFDSPLAYHLFNLCLHLANCLLIALMVNLLAGNRRYGWLAALLFCVYPLHPEAVTWLAGRFDLLSTTGQLLSFIFLIKFYQALKVKNRYYWWLIGTLVTYLAALLCKEAALFLPLIAAIYILSAGRIATKSWAQTLKLTLAVFFAFLIVTGLYLWLRVAVLQSLDGGEPVSYNLVSFVLPTLEALKVMLAPVNEVLLAKHFVWKNLLLIGCWLVCLVALLSSLINARKSTSLALLMGISFCWGILAIAPAQAVDYVRDSWQLGNLENSRVLYPASIGLCIILAIGLIELNSFLPPPNKFFKAKYLSMPFDSQRCWAVSGYAANQQFGVGYGGTAGADGRAEFRQGGGVGAKFWSRFDAICRWCGGGNRRLTR